MNQDALRVTRFLPGTAASALSARSHVRGGREDELAVYFDGVPLYEPFHYKDVQSLLGILDPDSISKIDFFSGVVPARYGNRLSGVLDLQPRVFSGDSYNAIGASLLYSHVLSQGQLDSYPATWLVSVRRGNVELFSDLIGRNDTEPDFLDALARIEIEVAPNATLSGGCLLLDDKLAADLQSGAERGNIEYRDATGWGSFSLRPGDASELRLTLSRTERHTNRVGSVSKPGNSQGTLDDRRRFDTTTLRLEGRARRAICSASTPGSNGTNTMRCTTMKPGAVRPELAAAFGRAPAYAQSTHLRADGEAYAAYASGLFTFSRASDPDLSLRWDAQRYDTAFHDNQLSPRLSLQYH